METAILNAKSFLYVCWTYLDITFYNEAIALQYVVTNQKIFYSAYILQNIHIFSPIKIYT